MSGFSNALAQASSVDALRWSCRPVLRQSETAVKTSRRILFDSAGLRPNRSAAATLLSAALAERLTAVDLRIKRTIAYKPLQFPACRNTFSAHFGARLTGVSLYEDWVCRLALRAQRPRTDASFTYCRY